MESNIDILQEMDPAQIFSLTGDAKVQEVIGRLKFMSMIRHGEKINIRELFVRDNDSILQRFLRTIRNVTTFISSSEIVESKDATLAFIQDIVNNAITLIAVYRGEKDKFKQDIANIIVENLENSKGGIRNLIATYQSDRRFISEAEAVIQTLEARIKSMTGKGYMPGITDASFMPIVDASLQSSLASSPNVSPQRSPVFRPAGSPQSSSASSPDASAEEMIPESSDDDCP